jgi:hypothetical protein
MDKIDKSHLACLAAGVGLASVFFYLKGAKTQEKPKEKEIDAESEQYQMLKN